MELFNLINSLRKVVCNQCNHKDKIIRINKIIKINKIYKLIVESQKEYKFPKRS